MEKLKKLNRKKYMRQYYQNKKSYLQNKSLVRSHKNELLKEKDLRGAIVKLLVNNSKRKFNCKIQKVNKITTLYFD